MPTFQGQTVDLHTDFEGTYPPTGWAETDANNVLSQDASAKYAGTYGLKHVHTGSYLAKIRYTLGEAKSTLSVGFWYYRPTMASEEMQVVAILYDSAGDYPLAVYVHDTYGLSLRNTGTYSAGDIALSASTWYWVTLQFTASGTAYCRVYDTSEAQVESEISVATSAFDRLYIDIGVMVASGSTAPTYWDDVVVDWTDATYPLLGWPTSVLYTGAAWGKAAPTDGERPLSWQTCRIENPVRVAPTVGDADWGKVQAWESNAVFSCVVDSANTELKRFTLTQNKYGTGDTATVYIRGSETLFAWNDVSPAWVEYTVPTDQTWRYVQVKVVN